MDSPTSHLFRTSGWVQASLVLIDWAAVFGGYALAAQRFDLPVTWAIGPCLVSGVCFQYIARRKTLYEAWPTERPVKEALRAGWVWVVAATLALSAGVVLNDLREVPRFEIFFWLFFSGTLLLGGRLSLRLFLRFLRKRGLHRQRVAIVGDSEAARRLADSFDEDPGIGIEMYGHYTPASGRSDASPASMGAHRGGLLQVVEDAKAGKLDVVYLGLPLNQEAAIRHLLHQLADSTVAVHVLADFAGFNPMHFHWSAVNHVAMVSVFDTPFQGPQAALKRLEDIVVGSFILALIALPMTVVALGVKLSSKGPVFFRQRRYGLNGKEIHVLKFRSMTVAEDGAKVTQATKNDARITPWGRIIRRTSLDELPQFIQVLTGEMSIVGPRPHAVAHNEEYRALIHGYMLRHMVKPGITGWAQVNGFRGETDTVEKMEKRVEHDLQYIRNWSLTLDMRIIWLTVFGRKVRENAY